MIRTPHRQLFFVPLVALGLLGCSGLSSYAVPTTSQTLPPRHGSVWVYATRPPTQGVELGLVEAQSAGTDQGVEVLFPEIARRVEQLGGNAVVLDWMGARFDTYTSWNYQGVSYPCPLGTCVHVGSYPVTQEFMTVILKGRAFHVPQSSQQGPAPAEPTPPKALEPTEKGMP